MEYIGSKKRLWKFIEKLIYPYIKDINSVCDLFSGTGVVAYNFKIKLEKKIIANDIQFYSYVQLKAILNNGKNLKYLNYGGLEKFINKLNSLKFKEGYFYKNYCPSDLNEFNRMFFTIDNAKKIDAIRIYIEKIYKNNKINETEYFYALFLLLNSVDKCSNTAVVFEAYLKKFKNSAIKPIEIKTYENIKFNSITYKVYNQDALKLIKKIKGDLLYLDPPYNSRQYSRNYHILETLVKYDNPKIKGKAGVRIDSFISGLSQKRTALLNMEEIVKEAKFKYILISYSNEGIIDFNLFIEMLEKYGSLSITEIDYSRFKSNIINTKAKRVTEYLILLKKEN
ncbi:DNA adenine methylase [Spiroplasma endosymbiont of Dioctria linearis]|uniref:DNA adenine methylase n=1 Tax=Spiroplasma endosymbiont of Dioctria linearis TaxID=3066290 RepID=UPI00313F1A1F